MFSEQALFKLFFFLVQRNYFRVQSGSKKLCFPFVTHPLVTFKGGLCPLHLNPICL